MRTCAVCDYLNREARVASGEMGLWTSLPAIVARAAQVLPSAPEGEQHVMLPVCSEHVAEIYRGRVPGLRMAWRLRVEPATPTIA